MRKKPAYILALVLTLAMLPTAVYAGEDEAPDAGISLENCFPDAYFRAVVGETYDLDGNGCLSDTEILGGDTYLTISNVNIKSLDGIEYLTQLLDLECSYTDLTSLDLSKNPNLESVYCESCRLTSLKLGPGIKNVFCSDNQLTSLDVSRCEQLKELVCGDNPGLTSLSLYGAANLENLNCDACGLDSLMVSGCGNLRNLSCAQNRLSRLAVAGLDKLQFLNCADNCFTSIRNVTGRNSNLSLGSSFLFYPQSRITEKKDLQDENCSITLSEDSYIYEAEHPPWEPTVTVMYDDAVLEEGIDYSIRYCGNESVGRAGVWVIADEDSREYIGSRIVYFDIKPQKPSKPGISMGDEGVVLKGTLPGSAGSCEPFRDDMKSGQHLDGYVELDGKKYNYYILSDPGRVNGKTYYYGISATGQGDDSFGRAYSEQSDRVSYLYLSAPSLKSAKNVSGRAMTVKWSRNTKSAGYKIQYSSDSSFRNARTVTVNKKSTDSNKISGLKKKKTYYVRVRAYKKSGKTTYYSRWSSVKEAKIKK